MVFLNCSAVATATTAQAHCATFTVNGPYAQPSACESFFIRAKKCNQIDLLALADVERLRTRMALQGVPLDVVGCWPQAVHNARTGKLKRFDWGAMILEIRAYGMDAASAAEAMNALQLECSFHLTATVEFDVWRQPVDGAAMKKLMDTHNQKATTLMTDRAAAVPLVAPGDENGRQRFVVLRKRVLA